MSSNVFGSKTFQATPPAKGSFPLDHDGECKAPFEAYMKCLKTHDGVNEACRNLSKAYLECRMDNGLMTRESLNSLGFKSK